MAIFNGYESNYNAEGACVERLLEQAALKGRTETSESHPRGVCPKKVLTFVMILIY